jgi:uncharacterized protein DUF1905/bacteriocin resistance YdeI/OmpD-like protein
MTKFRGTIELGGKTATGIRIPPEVVASLGTSKRPPVRVTIKGYTYRSSVAVMGGEFVVGVSAEVRKAAGVAAGDVVEVEMELDTQPREVAMPADFSAALAKDAKARKFFEGLSYSNRLRFVLSIEGAKTAETRERRIAKAVSTLHEGKT